MTPDFKRLRGTLRFAASLVLVALPSQAEIVLGQGQAVTGAKFIRVAPARQLKPQFARGQIFPVYDHSMVIDTVRHHLPPVDGPWRYYELGAFVYRVDAVNARVLTVEPRRNR